MSEMKKITDGRQPGEMLVARESRDMMEPPEAARSAWRKRRKVVSERGMTEEVDSAQGRRREHENLGGKLVAEVKWLNALRFALLCCIIRRYVPRTAHDHKSGALYNPKAALGNVAT